MQNKSNSRVFRPKTGSNQKNEPKRTQLGQRSERELALDVPNATSIESGE